MGKRSNDPFFRFVKGMNESECQNTYLEFSFFAKGLLFVCVCESFCGRDENSRN
jgi:hypothetical protein